MMFVQFFIWGGWFVTLGTFLGGSFQANGSQIGLAYQTQCWGAILSPLLFGLLADRYVRAERMLAVIHISGALLMWLMYQADDFASFYPYLFVYMLVYMPTLALANAVSFRHLASPSEQFGKVRVWGTLGWIAAGLVISALAWDSQAAVAEGALRATFLMCAIASVVLGLYCFSLPATPPQQNNHTSLFSSLGGDALKLLKDRNFLVFFVSSILICIPLAFYYQNTNLFLSELGVENATGKMTIGQMSEILFMLLLPVFLKRFGIKTTLLIGMAAWVLRYTLFAFGAESDSQTAMILIGIALHGVCYDFSFVSGQIYTDAKAGSGIKSSAQGLITLATYGAGMLVGFAIAGKLYDLYALANGHDWQTIWLFPAAFAAVIFILFLITFRSESIKD